MPQGTACLNTKSPHVDECGFLSWFGRGPKSLFEVTGFWHKVGTGSAQAWHMQSSHGSPDGFIGIGGTSPGLLPRAGATKRRFKSTTRHKVAQGWQTFVSYSLSNGFLRPSFLCSCLRTCDEFRFLGCRFRCGLLASRNLASRPEESATPRWRCLSFLADPGWPFSIHRPRSDHTAPVALSVVGPPTSHLRHCGTPGRVCAQKPCQVTRSRGIPYFGDPPITRQWCNLRSTLLCHPALQTPSPSHPTTTFHPTPTPPHPPPPRPPCSAHPTAPTCTSPTPGAI